MNTSRSLISLFIVLFLSSLFVTIFAEINPQFTTHRHLSNPRYAGIANAGAAIPEAVSSVMLNPSLIHSWHWMNETKYSATATYERDSVFSKLIVSTGASWQINEVTTIGSLYRNMKNGDDNYQNDIIVCVAGRLFDKSLQQGAVNLGMNMRIENCRWKSHDVDSLKVKMKNVIDTTDTSWYYKSTYTNAYLKETRLLFDLGFFQSNIFEGMDFGLTFHNLFTRVWKSKKPSVKDTVWYNNDSTVMMDSSYYTMDWEDSKGKFNKVYKRMTIGLAYHAPLMQNKVELVLPFDIEFLGLFDKKQDVKIGLHTGIEGWINKKVCLRFGYALSPKYIQGKPGDITFKNDNIFSGGASVHFERIAFDVYILGQNWGIGSTVAF